MNIFSIGVHTDEFEFLCDGKLALYTEGLRQVLIYQLVCSDELYYKERRYMKK